MNNKKKILVILIALFVCSGMFFITDMIKYSKDSKVATSTESTVKNATSEETNAKSNVDNKDESTEQNNNESTKEDTSTNQNNNESTENKTTNVESQQKPQPEQQTTTKQVQQPQPKPQSQGCKVIIQDSINGTTILSTSISTSNISVGEATTSALDSRGVDYKVTGFGPTMYFSSISGLSEKAAGPTSGWTYYIQKSGSGSFTKPGVSCGNYKIQDGDAILWKYVKDGV